MPKPKGPEGQSPRKKKSLRAIYARVREEFSAADLQRYTEVEEGVPAAQVLAEMEAIHRRVARKPKS
jgi:hypothetical protein